MAAVSKAVKSCGGCTSAKRCIISLNLILELFEANNEERRGNKSTHKDTFNVFFWKMDVFD